MSKHTPGPWKWQDFNNGGRRLMSLDGPVIDYANYEGMWLSRYDAAEDSANAQLIAAAPDLLAAARVAQELFAELSRPDDRAVSISSQVYWARCVQAEIALRAAITKATGEA